MRARPVFQMVRGCRVCDVLLLPAGVAMCRPCGSRVSVFLRRASPSFLGGLWINVPDATPANRSSTDAPAVSEAVAEFRASVASTLDDGDFGAHRDLAMAYEEMGLLADALERVAVALRRD